MCLLELFRDMGEWWWAFEMKCTCLGGFLLGGSDGEKWGDYRKMNLFIL